MRRILWCGGSHLAQNKRRIEELHSEYRNEFALTAGGFHKWYLEGNRLRIAGDSVFDLHAFRPSNQSEYSRADFDILVFVGQYIQPTRYFCGNAPISEAMMADMTNEKSFLVRLRAGHAIQSFRHETAAYPPFFHNQPLEYLLHISRGRSILIQDPIPNNPDFESVPAICKIRFQESVVRFCRNWKCELVTQREHTLSTSLTTCRTYNLRNGDHSHMNDEFWKTVFVDLKSILAKI
jgi:hypothetical protein